MTSESATAPVLGGIALLERALNYTLPTLHNVPPESLASPTPCGDWDLTALLEHLSESLLALRQAIDDGRVELVCSPELGEAASGSDPLERVLTHARALLGVWMGADAGTVSVGGCPLTTGIVGATGALEVAVHGWDIARACGVRGTIPSGLAEELLPLAPLLVGDADRPSRFAAPVAVSPAAVPGDRLVAFLGRSPAWPAR